MSRAFTKEPDDAPPAPTPDRPVSKSPNLVTPRGSHLIVAKMAELDRAIQGAEGEAEIDELRREQRYWAARLSTMQIIPPAEAPTTITFGVAAQIRRRGEVSKIKVVGEDEADPAEGLIAWTSPLALALEGAKAGDDIEFEAGGRTEEIAVIEVGEA